MIHKQTETRHLFHPNTPKNRDIRDNAILLGEYIYWLEREASDARLKEAMLKLLPDWTDTFVHVFVGNDANTTSPSRYIAVSWQETPDRQAIHWGERRPEHVEKYTVKGSPSYMLCDETAAAIVTMLPQGKR